MEEIAYVEDDAKDAEDHGEESRVVDWEILRRYGRRNVRLGRRWHSRVIRCARLLLHIISLSLSLFLSLFPLRREPPSKSQIRTASIYALTRFQPAHFGPFRKQKKKNRTLPGAVAENKPAY